MKFETIKLISELLDENKRQCDSAEEYAARDLTKAKSDLDRLQDQEDADPALVEEAEERIEKKQKNYLIMRNEGNRIRMAKTDFDNHDWR